MKKLAVIILLMHHFSYAQTKAWVQDAAPLHRAEKALTDVIIHDIFSPPVASRIYAYTNIAAYEVLAAQSTTYRSLYGQVKSFPLLKPAKNKICASLAAVHAFFLVGKSLVFSEAILQDSAAHILAWYKKQRIGSKEYTASLAYGQQVAVAVMQWAAADKYKETRSLRRYNYLKQEGKWLPTPPVYMAAVEPYWNRIRLMVLDSCRQFPSDPPPAFSSEKSSGFYNQAIEVYNIRLQLSEQEKAIANFWDCNPFAVSTEGHLNFATKKISPGGHWISIAGIVCSDAQADITKSASVYALTAIALFDAFIICWDEKYRTNVIRPESYINKYVDESWRPLLQTPPFPEYNSGHSVISTVSAKILGSIFGDRTSFNDNTEVDFGLPIKSFTSFTEACDEAAISRLYGGIHYRVAIESGQQQGRNLGDWIVQNIKLTR